MYVLNEKKIIFVEDLKKKVRYWVNIINLIDLCVEF